MTFFGLLILVFLSPFPNATNRPWSWSLWAILIALFAIIWGVEMLIKKQPTESLLRLKPFNKLVVVFVSVVFWALIQTSTSIPVAWVHPLWTISNETLGANIDGTISLNSQDTITAVMRLMSYALVFWLALFHGFNREKARSIFMGLMIAGFCYSIYGLIIHLGGINTIVWQDQWNSNALTSTFVNRNHFATYAGLTLICTLALLSEGVKTSSRYNLGGFLGLQRFLDNLIIRTWFPLLAFFVIGTALILTHSRGGFLSTLLAIAILLTAFNLNDRTRNINLLSVVSVFIIIGGWIFYVSADILVERFGAWADANAYRGRVYQVTWQAIKDKPWLGFGYGSFQQAFPLYKTLDIAGPLSSPLLWDYAHNTYLETIFELGLPAAIALFYCFFGLARICIKGLLTRKRDLIYPATGLAATTLIAGHALVDFSIQIPAVAYTYALLMGAACAQSFSSRQ